MVDGSDEIQGEIEGLMGDAAPGAPPREPESADAPAVDEAEAPRDSEDAEAGSEPAVAAPADVAGAGPVEPEAPGETPDPESDVAPAGVESLAALLETLEQRVTLLLERHEGALAARREADEARREMGARLERLREEGADPEDLLERIRDLESRNDRLAEHAAFLEGRIENLLTRVRYVVES